MARDSLITTSFLDGTDGTARILAVDCMTGRTYVHSPAENTYHSHSDAAAALAQIQGWFAGAIDVDRWRRLAGAKAGETGYGFVLVLSRDIIVTAAEQDARQTPPRGI